MPPIASPKTSRPKLPDAARGSLLIAAVSGRALARAAADAGYAPLVADFFADVDTEALAHWARKVPGDIARGFRWETLEPALDALCQAAPSPPLGLVYGSGFEDRPQLLAQIAARWPLLGNSAATVAEINDPARFFPALVRHAVPHPETRLEPPDEPTGWVAKRHGGAGGSHIAPAGPQTHWGDFYYQKLASGRTISALFAANAEAAAVLGISAQWTAPADGKPWRYGGAAQPAGLAPDLTEKLTEIVSRLTTAFGLRGLNSADFLVEGGVPLLLEINPRPGATLDIFENAPSPLMAVHLDAVLRGVLPPHAPAYEDAAASALVFAPEAVTIPDHMAWPRWAADLPRPGERIDKERPICTVLARGESTDQARRLVLRRVTDVLTALGVAGNLAHADQLHTEKGPVRDRPLQD